jgi:O-antigen/teichoic acid export membrane protein
MHPHAMRRPFASFWAILEYLWNPLLGILLTPVLLRTLGSELFGYWTLLFAAISLGAILNVGTGTAIVKRIAEIDSSDSSARPRLIRSAMTISWIGATVSSLTMGLCFQLGGALIFPRMTNGGLLIDVGWSAAIICLLEQLDNVFASTLKGLERFSAAAALEVASRTLQFAAVSAMALHFGTLEPVCVVVVVTTMLRLVAKMVVVGRRFGAAALLPSRDIDRQMLALARWGWAQGAGGVFFGIADRLIVGSMLGPSALGLYAVAVQLTQQLHAVSAAGASVLLPRLSRLGPTQDGSARVAWTIYVWMACAIVVVAVLLAIFGRQVLQLWLRVSVSPETVKLFRQLTVAFAVLAINVVPHFALLARSRVRRVAVSNIVAGAISCVLMLWLTPIVGIDAMGYAKISFGLITTAALLPVFVAMRFAR